MPKSTHSITREDIMDIAQYGLERAERRKAVTVMKKSRRVHVGPDATAYFENFDTVWHQIHEMLHIEQGGEPQIQDELNAYSTLIPHGRELVCTLMFEIDDEVRRAKFLAGLGGIEENVSLRLGDDVITATPERDIDRTNADGKASSIQFLHFEFTNAQAERLKSGDGEVVLSIAHEKYGHMAIMSDVTKTALASDLD